jgi:spore maturation protein SpmB
MLIIANVATQNIAVVSVVTQVLLVVVFVALTVALFRMTGALNRRAAACPPASARRGLPGLTRRRRTAPLRSPGGAVVMRADQCGVQPGSSSCPG